MSKIIKNRRGKFSLKSILQKDKYQTTQCYCPVCKTELISTNNFVGESRFVTFRCNNCKTDSKWIFNSSMPVCIESDIDKLRQTYNKIDTYVDLTIKSADNNPKIRFNMISIDKELKIMKEILDKY